MLKQSVAALALLFAAASSPAAQAPATPRPAAQPQKPAPSTATQPTPAPVEGAVQPAAARDREGQPVNIKLDISITDQGVSGEPSRKTVSMVMADRAVGSIRTGGTIIQTSSGPQSITINVDATPTIQRDGSIRLLFGLEYQPRPGTDQTQPNAVPPRMSQVNERLSVIVQDGKPLAISQAADAGSDRKVTVEVKATVLK